MSRPNRAAMVDENTIHRLCPTLVHWRMAEAPRRAEEGRGAPA
ncbi:hypothetical protein [Rhizobium paknamense]|uniref:Uncharacterized protein n=1 Tax=Rhizobium paknamense TaxID=1206817 RepID=A0ABU0IGF5_9HYPH|nr:hypothetical protein [Rhizobium paknamense]MDQ0457335.1 hypothetical protein [Rhizobium paknamense]